MIFFNLRWVYWDLSWGRFVYMYIRSSCCTLNLCNVISQLYLNKNLKYILNEYCPLMQIFTMNIIGIIMLADICWMLSVCPAQCNVLHVLHLQFSLQPCQVDYIISILPLRKVKLREVSQIGHTLSYSRTRCEPKSVWLQCHCSPQYTRLPFDYC